MRSALLAADYLVTVSRGYAAEVQRGGPMACGMHDILAARGIRWGLPRRCALYCSAAAAVVLGFLGA